MNPAVAIAVILLVATAFASEDAKRRIWTSADGKYSVDATFISLQGGSVTLKRSDDGVQINVPLNQLSADDQAFIRARPWSRAKPTSPFQEPPKESAKPKLNPVVESPWASFRGVPWGAKIEDTADMTEIHDDGKGTKRYHRTGDALRIGDTPLKSITYGFYKGRFYYVNVEARDGGNWLALRDAVFARYGEGAQLNRFMNEWTWLTEGVRMWFVHKDISRETNIYMIYRRVEKEKEADEKRRAKDAASDF